jgi:hypothetical protein
MTDFHLMASSIYTTLTDATLDSAEANLNDYHLHIQGVSVMVYGLP